MMALIISQDVIHEIRGSIRVLDKSPGRINKLEGAYESGEVCVLITDVTQANERFHSC
jgi:hypothetical protein